MEAWCEAKLAMLSLGGTFVCPSMRVMMSDWEDVYKRQAIDGLMIYSFTFLYENVSENIFFVS